MVVMVEAATFVRTIDGFPLRPNECRTKTAPTSLDERYLIPDTGVSVMEHTHCTGKYLFEYIGCVCVRIRKTKAT